MPINHEGAEYFSKAEIEAIVKDRVKNVEAAVTAWENKYKAVEPELAKVPTLAAELETWKSKATTAEGAFTRYQTAASYGVTDPDTIALLEFQHGRAMSSVEEAKRVDFGGYLGAAKADPNLLPPGLRGLFGNSPVAPQQAAPGVPAPGTPAQGAPAAAAPAAPPVAARPPWAPAVAGQAPVPPAVKPNFTERVNGAKTLDDIQKIMAERRR